MSGGVEFLLGHRIHSMIAHSKSYISQNHVQSVVNCLNSGLTSSGKLNNYFKDLFSEYIERSNVFLFSSGTSALYNLLISLEIDRDSEILIPNYICYSVYQAIQRSGFRPILYDNASNQWISSYEKIIESVTDNTKVIVLNHTFGQALPFVQQLKERYPEKIIVEDCCHLISNRSRVGSIDISLGHASFYSFNSTKLLAGGEGGALQINDESIHSRIIDNKLDEGLSDLTCSLLIEQLKDYDKFLEIRKEIVNFYNQNLNLKNSSVTNSIHFRYPLLVDNQDDFLSDHVVAFRKGVDQLISSKINTSNNLPNSFDVFNRTISLPIYPALNESELKTVVQRFNSHYDN